MNLGKALKWCSKTHDMQSYTLCISVGYYKQSFQFLGHQERAFIPIIFRSNYLRSNITTSVYDNWPPFSFLASLLLSFLCFFLFFFYEYSSLEGPLISFPTYFSSLFYSGFSLRVSPWISSSPVLSPPKKRKKHLYIPCHFQNFKNIMIIWTKVRNIPHGAYWSSSVGKNHYAWGDLVVIIG